MPLHVINSVERDALAPGSNMSFSSLYVTMQMALYDKRCPCSVHLPPARLLDVSTESIADMHAV
jgi:hypothetical protein